MIHLREVAQASAATYLGLIYRLSLSRSLLEFFRYTYVAEPFGSRKIRPVVPTLPKDGDPKPTFVHLRIVRDGFSSSSSSGSRFLESHKCG